MSRCGERWQRFLILGEGFEYHGAGLAPGVAAAMHNESVHFLADYAVHLVEFKLGCDTPDVAEGCVTEATSPIERREYTADVREYEVAQVLATVEALVAVDPDAISRVGRVGLTENLLKYNILNMCV